MLKLGGVDDNKYLNLILAIKWPPKWTILEKYI